MRGTRARRRLVLPTTMMLMTIASRARLYMILFLLPFSRLECCHNTVEPIT